MADVGGGALMRERSVASIPSKFETILHDGGRENDAFWSRTHRFTYTDNEMPGAGQYFRPRHAELVGPSYSQKGYTGMVSRSSRFVGARLTNAPPPGTYDPRRGFNAINKKREYSVAKHSSMFARPIVLPEHTTGRSAHIEPGPGAYNTAQDFLAPEKKGKHMPFGGSSVRFTHQKHILAGEEEDNSGPPAPGSYDPDSINRVTGALQAIHSELPIAAFKSRTGRKFDDLRHSQDDMVTLKPHPSMGPSLGIHVDIRSALPCKTITPGPGAYEPYIADQLLTLDKIRHSSMFSRTNQDRFGRPLDQKAEHSVTPGPGTYEHAAGMSPQKSQVSMAAFVSTALRGGLCERSTGQPGPAYYNPSLANKRSFHLNANGRWV